MRYNWVMVLVLVFVFAGGASAQEAKKDGWWIKANIQKQESQAMSFYVGATNHSYGFWKAWRPGDPAEFDIPQEYRNSPTIFILAQTTSGHIAKPIAKPAGVLMVSVRASNAPSVATAATIPA